MSIDLEAIKQRKAAADAEIGALCEGKRWRMSIPARPDYDSDLLISAALQDVPSLIAEVERLRSAAALALAAFRARRDVEEHMMEAAQYENCPDCCDRRPCPKFKRLEMIAQNAVAPAMAALRGALAKEQSDAH